MRPPRFKYCRVCGGRWVAISGVVERHKPGCRLLKPGRGSAITEAPRKVRPS